VASSRRPGASPGPVQSPCRMAVAPTVAQSRVAPRLSCIGERGGPRRECGRFALALGKRLFSSGPGLPCDASRSRSSVEAVLWRAQPWRAGPKRPRLGVLGRRGPRGRRNGRRICGSGDLPPAARLLGVTKATSGFRTPARRRSARVCALLIATARTSWATGRWRASRPTSPRSRHTLRTSTPCCRSATVRNRSPVGK
jgi:hypothetical protein